MVTLYMNVLFIKHKSSNREECTKNTPLNSFDTLPTLYEARGLNHQTPEPKFLRPERLR